MKRTAYIVNHVLVEKSFVSIEKSVETGYNDYNILWRRLLLQVEGVRHDNIMITISFGDG